MVQDLRKSPRYRVAWVVDLDASSPSEAAGFASEIQEQPGHTATLFSVEDLTTGGVTTHTYGDGPSQNSAHRVLAGLDPVERRFALVYPTGSVAILERETSLGTALGFAETEHHLRGAEVREVHVYLGSVIERARAPLTDRLLAAFTRIVSGEGVDTRDVGNLLQEARAELQRVGGEVA